jgi:hypothetical protein
MSVTENSTSTTCPQAGQLLAPTIFDPNIFSRKLSNF